MIQNAFSPLKALPNFSLACKQVLLFGRAKRATRGRARKPRSGEILRVPLASVLFTKSPKRSSCSQANCSRFLDTNHCYSISVTSLRYFHKLSPNVKFKIQGIHDISIFSSISPEHYQHILNNMRPAQRIPNG